MEDNRPEVTEDAPVTGSGRNLSGVLLMQVGRLAVYLVLLAEALLLFFRDRIASGAVVLVMLAIVAAAIWIAEHRIGTRLGLSNADVKRLEYSIFYAPRHKNALAVSPVLRFFPLGLGILSAVLSLVLPDTMRNLPDALGCLTGALLAGASVLAPFAALNVSNMLRRADVDVNDYLRLPQIAAATVLLADQSVFHSGANAELRGFFSAGALHPLSDLDFQQWLPLVLGFCRCDDGSLAAACGFRSNLREAVLRAMHTTPMEHRELLAPRPTVFTPYDPDTGLIRAAVTEDEENTTVYVAGLPESVLPRITRIADPGSVRAAAENDLHRVSLILQQIYGLGRQALALTTEESDGALTLLGIVSYSVSPVEGAEEAVQSLRSSGIPVIYVSREQESCAAYRAACLGITRDTSRVLTGARIDNFRPENLERMASRARVAADMKSEHRVGFTRFLVSRGETVLAASADPADPILAFADAAISVPSHREPKADVTVRGCRITHVAEICRAARAACDAAVRATVYQLSVSLAVTLFALLTVTNAVTPLTIPAAAFLAFLLPIPYAFFIAGRGTSTLLTKKTGAFGAVEYTPREDGRRKVIGLPFLICSVAAAVFAAVYTADIYWALSPAGSAGAPAASAASFLSLVTCSLVLGGIAFVWGGSLFTLMEKISRPLLWMGLVTVAACFGLLRLNAVNRVFSFDILSYRNLPRTIVAAVVLALLYELIRLVVRAIRRPRR